MLAIILANTLARSLVSGADVMKAVLRKYSSSTLYQLLGWLMLLASSAYSYLAYCVRILPLGF